MKLSTLLEGVRVVEKNADDNMEITTLCYDSRKVEEGSVFVCIKGFKTDGHAFIEDAYQKGCKVIVAEHVKEGETRPYILVDNSRRALALMSANYFSHPSRHFKLIGVTGTNGKTTTTYLLKSILEAAGGKVGLIGTNQNMIADEVLPAERTTPESYELQELFAYMAKKEVDYVVMEVSSHSLELCRVDGSSFDIGIFTNITQDHLDFHGTMENYLKAKTKLFQMSPVGILNLDDEKTQYMIENASSKNFTFSIERNDADVMAKNIRFISTGVDFEILSKDTIFRVELGIPGKFSVYNALGAITCAMVLGVDSATIAKALKSTKGVKGRVEVVDTPGMPFTVLIDYAHTPDGIFNVLSAVRAFAPGRVVTLFGCGGDRDKTKRPIMGKIAAEMSDFCIVTSDNPRTEDPQAIIADILTGMKGTKCEHEVIPNRKEAIAYALTHGKEGDVIVLAGKGHETYQVLKDETIHFDEREVVTEILQQMKK